MSKRPKTKRSPPAAPVPELSVTDAARSFSDVINRVRYRGERFMLTKGGLPVAELRPVAMTRVVTARDLASRLASIPHLGSAAATRLGADIDEARAAVGGAGASPWE